MLFSVTSRFFSQATRSAPKSAQRAPTTLDFETRYSTHLKPAEEKVTARLQQRYPGVKSVAYHPLNTRTLIETDNASTRQQVVAALTENGIKHTVEENAIRTSASLDDLSSMCANKTTLTFKS